MYCEAGSTILIFHSIISKFAGDLETGEYKIWTPGQKIWTGTMNPLLWTPYFYCPMKTKTAGMLDCWHTSPCDFTCTFFCIKHGRHGRKQALLLCYDSFEFSCGFFLLGVVKIGGSWTRGPSFVLSSWKLCFTIKPMEFQLS